MTAFLFMAAAITINGRQQRTDFQVGSRDLQQQIRDLVNQTRSGYYPNNSDFKCTLSAPNLQIDSGSTEQGKNKDCIYAGTALVFNPATVENERFYAYPLAGRRTVAVVGGESVKLKTRVKLLLRPLLIRRLPQIIPRRKLRLGDFRGLTYVGGRNQERPALLPQVGLRLRS
ncbi:hypothetical protein IPL68_03845 [Candidatus Saccharibacteria bacterium]|nr:MAG: hypothetical protein IPL68_03845 [Candidatus Saccharibacteria bacterium]